LDRQGPFLFVPGNTPHLNPLPPYFVPMYRTTKGMKGRGAMGIKYSGTTPSPLRGEDLGEGDAGQDLF